MKNILTMLIVTLPYLITIVYLFATDSENDQVDIQKTYHEISELKEEIPYIEDKKHDIWKTYHANGQLKEEIPYVDGKEHGISKWYYENGKPKEEIQWNHYKIIGRNYYDENGNIIIK